MLTVRPAWDGVSVLLLRRTAPDGDVTGEYSNKLSRRMLL